MLGAKSNATEAAGAVASKSLKSAGCKLKETGERRNHVMLREGDQSM
jgi:hypothetical protein